MYRVLGTLAVLLVALSCSAQLQIPMGGSSPSSDNTRKTRNTTRTLTGTVLDKSDKPIPNAVVYLKNTKTLAVKTYIAQTDGTYRFPELSPNVDYDLYAQKDGQAEQIEDAESVRRPGQAKYQSSDRHQQVKLLRRSRNTKAAISGGLVIIRIKFASCFRCWRASTT